MSNHDAAVLINYIEQFEKTAAKLHARLDEVSKEHAALREWLVEVDRKFARVIQR